MKKFLCRIFGHDPILRDDILVTLRGGLVNYGRVVFVLHERTMHVGDTSCSRCGAPVRVEGFACFELKQQVQA